MPTYTNSESLGGGGCDPRAKTYTASSGRYPFLAIPSHFSDASAANDFGTCRFLTAITPILDVFIELNKGKRLELTFRRLLLYALWKQSNFVKLRILST